MATNSCVVDRCRAAGGGPATWTGATRGSRICPDCRRRLSAAATRLPGLYRDCEDALTGPRSSSSERVRGALPAGVSLNPAAVAARATMLRVTSSWAAYIADQRAIPRRPRRAMPELAAFLLANLDWLAGQDTARDAYAELTAAVEEAEKAVDPPAAGRIEIGPCDQPGCDGTIYAVPRRTSQPGEVACGRGHRWPPSEWLLLSRRLGHAEAAAR
jgi:hypothetical protein